MINIVIPMAGAGSRFKEKGFDIPKPFIDIKGKMMIERVLDSLQYPDAQYVLVIQKNFNSNYNKFIKIISEKYKVKFITVDELTQGACCTALAAHELINNEVPVVFADSDNIFDIPSFKSFLDFSLSEKKIDGCLLTVKSNAPCFSYAKIQNDFLLETREKEVISNSAIAGVYYFSQGKLFCKCAIDLLIYGKKTKQEYYMSNVYNRGILSYDCKFKIFEIKSSYWHCVGTPEQLKEYEELIK